MRCALALALVGTLAAQQSRFDVRSRLVLVPATVTERDGTPVEGLNASDFLVLDNGRPQKAALDTIDTGVAPIALIIAVQSSGISAAVLEKTRRLAAMIQPLIIGERGCAGLVTFARHVTWQTECTKDADAFGRAFEKLDPEEHNQARLLDAVQSAIDRLTRLPNARRVLLLVSESRDRGSETALNAVTVAAQSANVRVYFATYSAFRTAFTSKAPVTRPETRSQPRTPTKDAQEAIGTLNGNPASKFNPKVAGAGQSLDVFAIIGELAHLSQESSAEVLTAATGGTVFPFTRQKALEQAIQKLGAELHSQYTLSFAPDTTTPGYHKLEVRLAQPGDFHVRARPGYWTQEPQ